jgi:hypothetical protein
MPGIGALASNATDAMGAISAVAVRAGVLMVPFFAIRTLFWLRDRISRWH